VTGHWGISFCAIAGLIGSTSAVRAAEATSEPAVADWRELDLDALLKLNVITASGGEAESSDLAPANVFTVLGSEIANQGWRSVADVLSHVPGIYLVDDYVTNGLGTSIQAIAGIMVPSFAFTKPSVSAIWILVFIE